MTAQMEMIEYTTATQMAAVFKSSVARLQSLIVQIGDECGKLKETFGESGSFDVDLYFCGRQHDANAAAATEVADRMKRAAWGQLIDKLGIRRIMSSSRANKLDDAISGNRPHYHGEPVEVLPDIDDDTIYAVLSGMVQSADEFLEEAIHEEYDHWKPSRHYADFKRNSEFTLNRKIIRPWMVERCNGGGFRPYYRSESHLIALDNIFHMLDGRGFPEGHRGPLPDAIRTCGPDGAGETEFFRFKCYKNGNLHLEFKRLDLLERFNQIAGRNRLPAAEVA